ncbi:MAG: host attachment protein [Rhizobiaceae bacterium]
MKQNDESTENLDRACRCFPRPNYSPLARSSGVGGETRRNPASLRAQAAQRDHGRQAGSSFASEGTRRSAMEYRSDPVREEERAFARRIARLLEERCLEDDFDRLVLFAAPRMLGDLRDAMTESVRKFIIAEIDKDLTKLSGNALREEIKREAPNLWI